MKNKWIITGVLWFAVIILTFYNASEIKRLKQESGRIESLHMDTEFWRENSKNIDYIKAEGEKLFFDIESVDMGYLAIDNRLKKLSSEHHLQNHSITKQQVSEAGGYVPVDLSFEGSYEDIFKWFQSVKNELPFLRAKSIKITINPISNMAALNGSFFFRYRIATANNE
ncbi:MAG: hypothetical protein WBN77_13790 [Desulfobacterales bacterium]